MGAARRRFTREERTALLAELEASGESVERFGQERGIAPTTLHMWRYRVRRASGSPSKPHRVFSPEERRAAVEAWVKSGLTAIGFAKLWGVSSESPAERPWLFHALAAGRRAARQASLACRGLPITGGEADCARHLRSVRGVTSSTCARSVSSPRRSFWLAILRPTVCLTSTLYRGPLPT